MWPWGTIKRLRAGLVEAERQKDFWHGKFEEQKATALKLRGDLDDAYRAIKIYQTNIHKLETELAQASKNDNRGPDGKFRKATTS